VAARSNLILMPPACGRGHQYTFNKLKPLEFVPETILDAVLEDLETGTWNVEEVLNYWGEQQPALLAFFFSETFDVLTAEEKPFLLYLAAVVWTAVNRVRPVEDVLDPEEIENVEETNWEMMNEAGSPRFQDRLNPFFDRTDQEDLLAFIEDSLVIDGSEEDDWKLTKEGREPIFIGLKTMVDCITR
jgi:hypothetical protein